jgi:DNA repair exonuclease SbcCD ATPase subunit
VQSVEQQLSVLRKENMALADQLLDKDAELSTLKSKVEAIHVEQGHQTKLEHMQAQLETELKKRQSLEVEIKVQLNQLEKERCTLMGESQQYQHQLQTVKEELELTHQSFNEYKLRAQRILQVRDKIMLFKDSSYIRSGV